MPRKLDLVDKVSKLRAFHKAHSRVPSYSEMLKLFRYRSKNSVYGVVSKLIRHGYLKKSAGKLAFTSRLTASVRLLGQVEAGFPSPAEEELVDVISLDEFLITQPEATFMLKVSGDSMIDAGIHPGDIVLVEKGQNPRTGDIVIAQVDGGWTMKYFGKDAKGVFLDPANEKYSRIRPENTLDIGGIVKAVIRKYG